MCVCAGLPTYIYAYIHTLISVYRFIYICLYTCLQVPTAYIHTNMYICHWCVVSQTLSSTVASHQYVSNQKKTND